jgi:hypothetical protein
MSVEEKTGSIEYPGIEYPEFVTLAGSARGTDTKPVRFDAVPQPHATLGRAAFCCSWRCSAPSALSPAYRSSLSAAGRCSDLPR